MLVVRLQRVGRHGHAQYRLGVQDSRWSPKSGKVVARLGSYNPHTKSLVYDKEKTTLFIKNGAHPSERVVQLLKADGLKLPAWVPKPTKKSGKPRKAEKTEAPAEAAPAPEAEASPKAEESAKAEAPQAPAEETPEAEKKPEGDKTEAA